MAKKLTPRQVANEIDDIVTTFSGKGIGEWIREGWDKYRQTTIGQTTAPLERAARAMDPYAVLGLPRDVSLEDVNNRVRQLSNIYHPDREGGNEDAMKLVNNARDEIKKKLEGASDGRQNSS